MGYTQSRVKMDDESMNMGDGVSLLFTVLQLRHMWMHEAWCISFAMCIVRARI